MLKNVSMANQVIKEGKYITKPKRIALRALKCVLNKMKGSN